MGQCGAWRRFAVSSCSAGSPWTRRLSLSTNKRVRVERFDRETLLGFVSPQTYLTATGLELLGTTGSVAIVPYDEIKTVCFVRDFEQDQPRRDLRQFTARPKFEGLWIRMFFRDGDVLDGMLSNNLLQLEERGFSVLPPDPNYQNQRLFVPRAALKNVQVLGVVGSPLRSRTPRGKPAAKEQIDLFGEGREAAKG